MLLSCTDVLLISGSAVYFYRQGHPHALRDNAIRFSVSAARWIREKRDYWRADSQQIATGNLS